MDLEKTLNLASSKIWKELEPVFKQNVKLYNIREEALTTMALKEIARANCSKILRMEMIPPQDETIRGYDFEICIGNAKKRKFVRFFIQAKKLNGINLNSSYSTFDQKQNIKLEAYSKMYKSIPLYALFNYLENSDAEISPFYNSHSKFSKESLGITLCTTTKLKIPRKKKFKDIHNTIVPNYHRTPYYRYHPLNLDFYEDALQCGVPFSELAYFDIKRAEEFNLRYNKLKFKNSLGFFFFFFDQNFFDDGENLVPILNKDEDELINDFHMRYEKGRNVDDFAFRSRAILIINQELNE